MLLILKALALLILTAFTELLGSYLMYLHFRQGKPAYYAWLAFGILGIFGYLLTLHPGAAARTYAAYGGIYVGAALMWLWQVEGHPPNTWDVLGVLVILVGTGIIIVNSA